MWKIWGFSLLNFSIWQGAWEGTKHGRNTKPLTFNGKIEAGLAPGPAPDPGKILPDSKHEVLKLFFVASQVPASGPPESFSKQEFFCIISAARCRRQTPSNRSFLLKYLSCQTVNRSCLVWFCFVWGRSLEVPDRSFSVENWSGVPGAGAGVRHDRQKTGVFLRILCLACKP